LIKRNEIGELVIDKESIVVKLLRFIIVILLVIGINSLYAQSKFKAGIKAGLSSSQVSGDNASGFHHFGLSAGGFVKTTFNNEKFSGRMELIFTQKGSRKNANPDNNDYGYYQLDLDYFEAPILLGYKNNKFTFETGPSIGILAKSYENGYDSNGSIIYQRPFFRKEISINLGIEYPLTEKLMMNWRLSNSILPIRDHLQNTAFRLNRGQYNTVMTFTLNYQFNT
jgi:hypothetical protein